MVEYNLDEMIYQIITPVKENDTNEINDEKFLQTKIENNNIKRTQNISKQQ